MKYDFIKVGATVCWHDPEGISEGEYKVASVPDNLEDDSVVLITSDFSEAEVFPYRIISGLIL